nr:hypothetical protein B0A51_06735 [Rachicladosporium sp. CCFEE 5018]
MGSFSGPTGHSFVSATTQGYTATGYAPNGMHGAQPHRNGFGVQPTNMYGAQMQYYAPTPQMSVAYGPTPQHHALAHTTQRGRQDSGHVVPPGHLAFQIKAGMMSNGDDELDQSGPDSIGGRRRMLYQQPTGRHPQKSIHRQPHPGLGRSRSNSRETGKPPHDDFIEYSQPAQYPGPPIGRPLPIATSAPPAWFAGIQHGYLPNVDDALASLPLHNALQPSAPCKYGVIRFSNIPYGVTRNEFIATVGRNASIVNQPQGTQYHGIHIIMDRNTGKTMDAFMEVATPHEAVSISLSLSRRATEGRPLKLNDRPTDVEVSSQEALMAALFPRAKQIQWVGTTPRLIPQDLRYYDNSKTAVGFNGFIQSEELDMLLKFVENPARGPFTQRTPNRLYESMISTLHKYPWTFTQYIRLSDRKMVFDATVAVIRHLVASLRRNHHPNLHPGLLQELTVAALTCVGFSEQQKHAVIVVLNKGGYGALAAGHCMSVRMGGDHRLSANWPFLALTFKVEVNDEVLDFYIRLLTGTTHSRPTLQLPSHATPFALVANADPFANFTVNYGTTNMASLTLNDVARREFDAVMAALHRELGGQTPSSYGGSTLRSRSNTDVSQLNLAMSSWHI